MEMQNNTDKGNIAHRAIVALSVAMMIAGLTVFEYLASTQFGTTIGGMTVGVSSLMRHVLGGSHGLGDQGAEALFIISARFILVTSLLWAPLLFLFSTIGREQKRQRKRSTMTNPGARPGRGPDRSQLSAAEDETLAER